ncbi:MAG TPA: hypothetical protein VJL32_00710 [Candidatus Paceibacterota bacterium]
MSLRKTYQDYQETFLAFYALVIVGVIAFFYVYGIVTMIKISNEATSINKSAGTEIDFKLKAAADLLEQRSALQKN